LQTRAEIQRSCLRCRAQRAVDAHRAEDAFGSIACGLTSIWIPLGAQPVRLRFRRR
jgi:hypothetical protein